MSVGCELGDYFVVPQVNKHVVLVHISRAVTEITSLSHRQQPRATRTQQLPLITVYNEMGEARRSHVL